MWWRSCLQLLIFGWSMFGSYLGSWFPLLKLLFSLSWNILMSRTKWIITAAHVLLRLEAYKFCNKEFTWFWFKPTKFLADEQKFSKKNLSKMLKIMLNLYIISCFSFFLEKKIVPAIVICFGLCYATVGCLCFFDVINTNWINDNSNMTGCIYCARDKTLRLFPHHTG